MVEQLCRNYYLREKSSHIVCLPILISYMWRKQLSKVVDLIVTLSFDKTMWPRANHERLILVIVFPFAHRRPWKLQGTQFVVDCERDMQKVWEKEEGLGGDCLRKLLVSAGSLEELPEHVVRKMLLRGGRRKLSSD